MRESKEGFIIESGLVLGDLGERMATTYLIELPDTGLSFFSPFLVISYIYFLTFFILFFFNGVLFFH